jgi:hypothetical protein
LISQHFLQQSLTSQFPGSNLLLEVIFKWRENARMGQATDPRAKREKEQARTFERACPICRKETMHAFLAGSFVCVECFPEVGAKVPVSGTSPNQPRS